MRYDKKVDLVKTEIIEDDFGGLATESDIAIGTIDCFIAPETIKYIDMGNGQKTRIAVTKIFTKASIDLEAKERTEILRTGYNRTKFNRLIGIRQVVKEETLKMIYLTNRYHMSAITDLGKLTMIEVERDV